MIKSNTGCPQGTDVELLCVQQNGGVYDAINQSCTIGENSYSNAGLCQAYLQNGDSGNGENGDSGNGGSSFNWLGAIQSFDFGIFSSAYCNIYPLLNQGNIPPACKPPQTGANGQPEPAEDTPKTGRYLLAILLVVVVAVVSYFLIKRAVKK